jgi:outer membrane protein OmpU
MKKLLLASTALVLSAGIAAADVTVGGSGRMGIVKDFGTAAVPNPDMAFTSRIRISFAASGETDGGLTFGGSIRADNAPGGNSGTAGSVFISGAFGRLSMGDVPGAAEAAVGDVSGVGLTGLGDLNEASYLSNNTTTANSNARSAMRYDYTTGAFGFHISANNPIANPDAGSGAGALLLDETYSVAVTYSSGAIKFGLGYETTDVVGAGRGSASHIIAGGAYTVGDATLKAFYGVANVDGSGALDQSLDQYGVSVDYKIDALTLTAFYTSNEVAPFVSDPVPSARLNARDSYGIGATYSLGGGASLAAGYVNRDDGTANGDDDSFDFGINLTF